MRRNRDAAGFTLVELLIVVALIGVLAAIAIPSFLDYQAKSRRSEAFMNLAGMARAQKGYFAVKDVYFESNNAHPLAAGTGTRKHAWDAVSEAGFAELGWAPEGQVFYAYDANTPAGPLTGVCSCTICFTGTAYGDVDGDTAPGYVMYVEPGISGGECQSGFLNGGTPVEWGTGAPVYNQVAVNRRDDEF